MVYCGALRLYFKTLSKSLLPREFNQIVAGDELPVISALSKSLWLRDSTWSILLSKSH